MISITSIWHGVHDKNIDMLLVYVFIAFRLDF